MPIPYPPINRLAVIGDRRTAAMVAADGTVNRMCLPNYNCPPIFGALLDASQGGYWRVGPEQLAFGQQSYVDDSAVLVTRWDVDGSVLEVTDFMPWPEGNRGEDLQDRRALIRRVRAPAGPVNCVVELSPRDNFQPVSAVATLADGLALRVGEHQVQLWSSAPLGFEGAGPRWAYSLEAGEEFWLAMETGGERTAWDSQRAQAALEATIGYWSRWNQRLTFTEAVAGETGPIAEEMDPRNNEFLGNTPLIFSLVEYIRALMEIDKSRPLSKAALMMGQMKNKAERFIDG